MSRIAKVENNGGKWQTGGKNIATQLLSTQLLYWLH
jgi:hypothetical protein